MGLDRAHYGPDHAGLGGTNPYDDRLGPELLSVLEAVEARLPDGRHVDLDAGILAITEVLIARRLAATTDPVRLSWLHGMLAWRRGNAGRRQEALLATEEAVRLNRLAAAADPRYRRHLAVSLTDLCNRLSAVGRGRSRHSSRPRSPPPSAAIWPRPTRPPAGTSWWGR